MDETPVWFTATPYDAESERTRPDFLCSKRVWPILAKFAAERLFPPRVPAGPSLATRSFSPRSRPHLRDEASVCSTRRRQNDSSAMSSRSRSREDPEACEDGDDCGGGGGHE